MNRKVYNFSVLIIFDVESIDVVVPKPLRDAGWATT